MKNSPFVVQNLIAVGSVNMLVGDSNAGKTPFAMQLALCVAAGIPFLGLKTTPGLVLYFDFENGVEKMMELYDRVREGLGIAEDLDTFRLLYSGTRDEIASDVREGKPSLIIIDTMRSFNPDTEESNTKAANVMRWLKNLSHVNNGNGTSSLFLHHPKKDQEKHERPSLDSTGPMQHWLSFVAGASAIVNQSDTRIGFEAYESGQAEAIVRATRRGEGEFGPLKLGRIRQDQSGDELAYVQITGKSLLGQKYREALGHLPEEFHFTDAVKLLGWNKKAVSNLLRTLISSGLLEKLGKLKTATKYKKTQ